MSEELKITNERLAQEFPEEHIVINSEELSAGLPEPENHIVISAEEVSNKLVFKIENRELYRTPLDWATESAKSLKSQLIRSFHEYTHSHPRWFSQDEERAKTFISMSGSVEDLKIQAKIFMDKVESSYDASLDQEIKLSLEEEELKFKMAPIEEDRTLNRLKDLYQKTDLDSPIYLLRHQPQKYLSTKIGSRYYSSCVIASMANALDALEGSKVSQDEIISSLGGLEKTFEQTGFVRSDKIEDYFFANDFQVDLFDNIIQLVKALEKGAVAVGLWGGHARLISGVYKNDSGEIFFRINDPYPHATETVEISASQIEALFADPESGRVALLGGRIIYPKKVVELAYRY